jgi:hypothetical protein
MNTNYLNFEMNEVKKIVSQLVKKVESRPMDRKYLKTTEACEYLSCSKNTLRKICGKYRIYPHKVLSENYYAIADLEKVFDRGAV